MDDNENDCTALPTERPKKDSGHQKDSSGHRNKSSELELTKKSETTLFPGLRTEQKVGFINLKDCSVNDFLMKGNEITSHAER